MKWSMGEVEAMARKAARGGGLSWGLADEAGRATRWLATQGQPGCAVLVALLDRSDGMVHAARAAQPAGARWSGSGPLVCPITLGASLNDHAEVLAERTTWHLEQVVCPIFLAPFASQIASVLDTGLTLSWPGVTLGVDRKGLALAGEAPGPVGPVTVDFVLTPAADAPAAPARPQTCVDVEPEVAKALERFASRTYAPATEESRAGAG